MSGPVFPPTPPGQPPMGPPWPQGPCPQQQPGQWPQPGPPTGPPSGGRRWLLLALTLVAVIAVTVACTMWFTRRGSDSQAANAGGSSQGPNGANGEIASANDTGPVAIITEDPTCSKWVDMQNQASAQLTDWAKRDASIPASAWTPEQRQIYETAARVFRAEAEQLVPLVRETPHRVVREIYEQVIAYDRAYADAIQNFTPSDDRLAIASNGLSTAQFNICQAITNYSAASRGPSVPPAAQPTAIAPMGDPAKPQKFLIAPTQTCSKVNAWVKHIQNELEQWFKTDPSIPASQRGSADTVLWDMAATVLGKGADELDLVARASGNAVMEDFLILSAQYFRGYVEAIPSYTGADRQLYEVGQKTVVAVRAACNALPG